MRVQKVERRKSKFGEDYALIGNIEHGKQASVSVPEKAMERQMANILKIDDVDDLKGRFVTVSRSDEPGPNGKLFWNVEFADTETYVPPTAESKRVQPPADTRTSGQKAFDAAVPLDDEQKPAQSAAPQLPLSESQARPRASEPVTEKELTDLEKKQRAGMVAVRTKYRALWESEAEFQVLAALRVRKKIAHDLELALADVPTLVVDGSSVNAQTASLWITFDRRNYV